jgi:hypothetical protein
MYILDGKKEREREGEREKERETYIITYTYIDNTYTSIHHIMD